MNLSFMLEGKSDYDKMAPTKSRGERRMSLKKIELKRSNLTRKLINQFPDEFVESVSLTPSEL